MIGIMVIRPRSETKDGFQSRNETVLEDYSLSIWFFEHIGYCMLENKKKRKAKGHREKVIVLVYIQKPHWLSKEQTDIQRSKQNILNDFSFQENQNLIFFPTIWKVFQLMQLATVLKTMELHKLRLSTYEENLAKVTSA